MLLGEALQRWTAWNSTEVCELASGDGWLLLGLCCAVIFATLAGRKFVIALLTFRALALTPLLSRRLSKLVKSRDYSDEEFFRADGAEERWVELRKKAIDRWSVFYRLGKVRVFYGNRLEYELPWCRGFPFSLLKHPQYVGTVLAIWGLFLAVRFPHDDWYVLPALETVYDAMGAYFEQ